MGRTSTTDDTAVAVYAQTSQAGRPYVELQVTGQASIDLARAIVQRLAGQGVVGPRVTEALVTLVAGAITDHPVELTPEQADDLATELQAAADHDAERDENTYWGESA
ncbi:hypothetical protein [Ornithinimicrobium sufpigmenti]|uniref:hypothetical protein n=1 Tax=Ornithinimicrobium sufpigmenti TaxID=2508882 RepID=UPI0010368F27|nr:MULTISPECIES: hypothetical protein [unclassified Ornithinimicrobium]